MKIWFMCQKHTINCKQTSKKKIVKNTRLIVKQTTTNPLPQRVGNFQYWSCSEAPPQGIEGISTKIHKHICTLKPAAIISKHLNQPIKLSLVQRATPKNN